MPDRPTVKASVVLQREAVESRWETHAWSVHAVIPDVGGAPRTLVENAALMHRLFPGFELTLFPDEAEGYFLNWSSEAPSVFVSMRQDEGESDWYPFLATVSYNEAARWMDGGEKVERAPAWPELTAWLGQWVEDNYRPEPKKRRKPRSFEGKEGVLREEGQS